MNAQGRIIGVDFTAPKPQVRCCGSRGVGSSEWFPRVPLSMAEFHVISSRALLRFKIRWYFFIISCVFRVIVVFIRRVDGRLATVFKEVQCSVNRQL
jgi:hypothetical protein